MSPLGSPAAVELRNVELHYFAICGRGEPIRLMLEDAGIAYTEVNLDGPSWKERKWDLDTYQFNQIPVLKVNGFNLAQLDAILRYVAKAAGYGGNGNLQDEAVADMLQAACEDLHVSYVRIVYGADAVNQLLSYVKEHVPTVLKQFERLLKQSKSSQGYFVYEYPSPGEFHLYYLLYALSRLHPNLLAEFSYLAAWRAVMSTRQGIRAYETSGRRKEMLNMSPSGQNPVLW
ncbi:hypothetical protein DAEQUDRAFT_74329 [Daedalea quercina L-15889]|uniref:Glutathione S-transferase n=1 Tax=Daedalea quercina L-15889 TaxID=1314783 RepID=A0A165L4A5_9APHY|nr:hypothetical protein DAEQUDRAFT_74329 [Daedalea quercina L-15889]